MSRFNNGRPYHPSHDVTDGKLRGVTDYAGHLYLLCPHCANNEILQILDFSIERDGPVKYAPEARRKAKRDFKIAFNVYCLACRMTDFIEISNDAWQGGKLASRAEPGVPPVDPD